MNPTESNRSYSIYQNKISVTQNIYYKFHRLFQTYNDFCIHIDECLDNLCKGRRLKPVIIIGNSSDIFIALEYITFMLELELSNICAVQDILAKGISWLTDIITSERFVVITAANTDEIYRLPESFLKRCTIFNLRGNSSDITLRSPMVSGDLRTDNVIFFDATTNHLWLPDGRKEPIQPSKGKIITAMFKTSQDKLSCVRKEDLLYTLFGKNITPSQCLPETQDSNLRGMILAVNTASKKLTRGDLVVSSGVRLLRFAQKIEVKPL